jgi:hypothetical protein
MVNGTVSLFDMTKINPPMPGADSAFSLPLAFVYQKIQVGAGSALLPLYPENHHLLNPGVKYPILIP